MEMCQKIGNWKIVRTADVKIPASRLIELEHMPTGARYLHLANERKENVFVVAFTTIPTDSSGVAHILEHTVLCGSERYPVRDPFFSMVRRSLQTFMNAFTSEDWTAYPFASPNKKDFFNLMSVYLDAAFFPRLDLLSFRQEGWRYAFEEGKLRYDGVVYNEMKGSMSIPERHMGEALHKALYEQAPYCHNTGGEPSQIPALSHEALVAFHKHYYHPSNAFFFSFGNIPLEENLRQIDEQVMSRFARGERYMVKPETRRTAASESRHVYPAADDDKGYAAALSWLCCPAADNDDVLGLELLEDILLGNQASPLRQALLDSGLGSDLSDGSGYDSEPRDTMFNVGLKDIRKESIKEVEKIIMATLERLSREGVDKELVEALVVSAETRKRNEVNQPYPLGLQVFLDVMAPWQHGGDIVAALDFDTLIGRVKERIAQGGYFEGLIKRYLIDNPHRSLVVLEPDKAAWQKQEEAERSELDAAQANMTEAQIAAIKKEAQDLAARQNQAENLDSLPRLALADVDREIERVAARASAKPGLDYYDARCNGLLHLVGEMDFGGITADLRPYLPVYAHLLSRLATSKRSFGELAKRLELLSGSLSIAPQAMRVFDDGKLARASLFVSTYAQSAFFAELAELLAEVLKETDFSDEARIRMLLEAMRADFRSSLVENGSSYAVSLAASSLSAYHALNEEWGGLAQFALLEKTLDERDDSGTLKEKLFLISNAMQSLSFGSVALVGEKPEDARIADQILPKDAARQNILFANGRSARSAYAVPAGVAFVAAACLVPDMRHADAPAISVLAKILSRNFLHNEIREKRGAYGASARYDQVSGLFSFSTYRDPNIVSSLDIFGACKRFVQSGKISANEVEEAIISLSAELDRPTSPAEAAKRAYVRKLNGIGDEMRKDYKERLLTITAADLLTVGERYLKDSWTEYSVAVLASKEKISQENVLLGDNVLALLEGN